MINITLFKMFITLTLIMTNLISLSFLNLFNTWFMMEISSMSMVSLMMINKSKKTSIIYFIISFISSSILIMSISMFQLMNINEMNYWLMIYITISLMLKMGLMPFHSWLMKSSENLNWFNLYLMLMFAKIIPMYMLYQFMLKMNSIIIYILMMNMILPTIMAINEYSLKKIMIYSSINQSSTMILSLFLNMNMFYLYFFIYMFTALILFMHLDKTNINNKNMINLSNSKMNKFMYLIIVTINSSLPPMFSFTMKWSILENLILYNPMMMLMSLLITLSSLFMTWNYLNLNNMNYYLYNTNVNFKMTMIFKFNKFTFINFMMMTMFMFYSFMIY